MTLLKSFEELDYSEALESSTEAQNGLKSMVVDLDNLLMVSLINGKMQS